MRGQDQLLANSFQKESGHTVMTVGRLEPYPNALNVIAGRVRFSIDFRSPSEHVLERGEKRLHTQLGGVAARRSLDVDVTFTERLPGVPLDPGVCHMLHDAAGRLNIGLGEAKSGALHDTAILAPFMPAAMLFVASRGGIGHNPSEFSSIEHIALAACVLVEAFQT